MRVAFSLLLSFSVPMAAVAQDSISKQFFFPDGAVSSEGPLVNGRPDGYWRTYYPSGQLKSEGNRREFKLDSLWVFYNESGLVTQEICYAADRKNGPRKSYDEEGRLLRIELFKDDVRTVKVEEFYHSGNLKEIIPIDTLGKGLEHGIGYEFDEQDGRVISVVTYSNGYVKGRERINRKDKFNQRQELWREFHDNMVVQYEGRYRNDNKDGYWKEFDRQGNLLHTVKYDNGILVEEPSELAKIDIKKKFHPNAQVKSVGSYLKGVEEGVHRFFSDKGVVESAKIYKQGKVAGEGIVDPEGRRQGDWKEFYETGELRSKGRYVNNRREGRWIFYYRDGKVEQEGEYVKGLADGNWKWLHPSGNTWREEIFYEGKEEGLAVELSDSGQVVAKGSYIDGEREGQWIIDVGEHREEGEYKVGQRYGMWKFYFKNGKMKYEGKFVVGKEEGIHNQYYSNGQLKETGRYKFGEKEGDWKYLDEDGTVRSIVTYERGLVVKVDGVRVSASSGTK